MDTEIDYIIWHVFTVTYHTQLSMQAVSMHGNFFTTENIFEWTLQCDLMYENMICIFL